MDKVTRYQEAILKVLNEYAKIKPSNIENIDNQVIADKTNNHFQLMRVGWDKNEFIHDCVMHFDIKDAKVWIQCNWTDIDVAEELMSYGVARQDIVLGFIPENERAFTGYAA